MLPGFGAAAECVDEGTQSRLHPGSIASLKLVSPNNEGSTVATQDAARASANRIFERVWATVETTPVMAKSH